MKDKKNIYPIICLTLGAVLVGLSIAGLTDEFWSGMGSALLVIGILRLMRAHRLKKNDAYREKMEIAETDERLHFIRSKAWAWAGYLYVIIASLLVIVLKLLNQELLMQATSFSVCMILLLYWVSYLFLRKKY